MKPITEQVSTEVELLNDEDLMDAEARMISPHQVRRMRIRAVVKNRYIRMVIPESVAQQLGFDISGQTLVRYSDGRTAQRPIAQRIRVACCGRASVFNAVVEPGLETARLGSIVLETLDLVVDAATGSLQPRDPKQIISEA